MEFQLIIHHTEVIKMLQNAGIEVMLINTPVTFRGHGNSSESVEMVPVWMVKNPQNGKVEDLHNFIKKYIELKKQELFLQEDNKLKILNLFSK